MVKRQTPRPQSHRRQRPVGPLTVVNPATTTPREAMIVEEASADVSPAAMIMAIDGPPTENVAPEPFIADDVLPEPLDHSADEHAPTEIAPTEIAHGVAYSISDLPTAAFDSMAAPADVPVVVPTGARKPTSLIPEDIAAASATLQAFVLNESLAAFAHWRALATARSPADAVRLHVDEMQRAAEASLTCMGRMAGHLGRAAAAA